MVSNYALFQLVTGWAIIITGSLALLLYWNPHALTLAIGKRFVWICRADGSFQPIKATLEGAGYRTKKHGLFEFEREDVVMYAGKPGILAFGPYSKALRPDVVPVLNKLKKLGIDRYDVLMGILTAEFITEDEFLKLQKQQIQQQQQSDEVA